MPPARGFCFTAVVLLSALLPLPAFAQVAPTLGLAEILSTVEVSSPELTAAGLLRGLSQAERTTAGAYPNPEVEVSGGPWRSRVGASSGTTGGVSIAQPLELPSVRQARMGVADAGVDAAESQIRLVRLGVGYQTRQAFYELLRRQEDERLSLEASRLLEDIQRRVQRRVEVGEAPRFELVKAEAEALTAQNAAASARLRTEEARGLLRRLAANRLPPQFEVRGSLPPRTDMPPLSALQQDMLASHPQLRVLAAERERAGARLRHERALRQPQPTLRAGQTRDPETNQTLLGISVPLPLWNRREGPIAQALGQVDIATAQIEAGRAQLARELDSAYARVGIARRQIQTFEGGLLRSAETALEVAQSAWRFGERSFLEVLDAQRTLRSVRSDYNSARFEHHSAWLDIERLLARDPFRTE
jgi:cobalt-zinc-cadmium efflux system outer membrane protein